MSEDFESLPPAVRRKVRVHCADFLPSSLQSLSLPLTRSDFSFPSPIAPSTEDRLNPIGPDFPVFSIFPFPLSTLAQWLSVIDYDLPLDPPRWRLTIRTIVRGATRCLVTLADIGSHWPMLTNVSAWDVIRSTSSPVLPIHCCSMSTADSNSSSRMSSVCASG